MTTLDKLRAIAESKGENWSLAHAHAVLWAKDCLDVLEFQRKEGYTKIEPELRNTINSIYKIYGVSE